LGSHRALRNLSPTMPWASIKQALNLWVRAKPYRRACASEGSMRHALDGTPMEPVTPEHRAHARRGLT
jgi:sRNA-binding protein